LHDGFGSTIRHALLVSSGPRPDTHIGGDALSLYKLTLELIYELSLKPEINGDVWTNWIGG
jgi:hypothetical protein